MRTKSKLKGKPVSAVILDVRGTVLSPWDDAPLGNEVRQILADCFLAGITINFASGTSLDSTCGRFVFAPVVDELCRRGASATDIRSCVAYLETGTVAFRLDAENTHAPLEGYEPLAFSEAEQEKIDQVITDVSARHGRSNVRRKFKPGQVNCYVGGPWPERRQIADDYDKALQDHGLGRPIAQVPSARETIDIALSTKRRSGEDYLRRSGVSPREILLIGDSFQPGGNDEPLWQALPGATAVHVGELPPATGVQQASRTGPDGVLEALNALIAR